MEDRVRQRRGGAHVAQLAQALDADGVARRRALEVAERHRRCPRPVELLLAGVAVDAVPDNLAEN